MKAMRPGGALSGGGAPIRILPTYQAATGSSSRRGLGAATPSRSISGSADAEPRQPGIEHHQIGQLDADAAETHGETGRLALRQHQRGAGLRQPRAQAADADLAEHRDGGNVERHLQRAAHRHRALEREIEILRRVAAVARRPVVDQRFRMQQAVLEAETVDERLQGRAGRAQRLRHVDLAGAALVEIIGGGDTRTHLAARIVDREDGDRNLRAERVRPFARQLLQRLLQAGVDGEPVNAAVGLGGDDLIGGMRRQHRQSPCAHAARLRISRARSRRAAPRRPPPRDRARGRAPPAPRPESDPAGAIPATAAAPPEARLRRATAGAAPCRNRRARRRGCLPDCRHRAPASDRATEFRPC